MLELDINRAEEVILKLIVDLEKKLNSKSGMTPEEVRNFYNSLLQEAFTQDSVKHYQSKK